MEDAYEQEAGVLARISDIVHYLFVVSFQAIFTFTELQFLGIW
jgi:hypothetical protein